LSIFGVAKGSIRWFNNLYMEEQTVQYDSDDYFVIQNTSIQFKEGVSGSVMRNQISFTYTPWNNLTNHFVLSHRTLIEGQQIFKNVWSSIPVSTVKYYVIYSPVKGFHVWGYFNRFSSTKWIEYQDISGDSDTKHNSTLAAITTVDIALQKKLWYSRLNLKLIVRNLFDRENKYHPLGASSRLSFYIYVQYSL